MAQHPAWHLPLGYKDGEFGAEKVPSGAYLGDRDMFLFRVDGNRDLDDPTDRRHAGSVPRIHSPLSLLITKSPEMSVKTSMNARTSLGSVGKPGLGSTRTAPMVGRPQSDNFNAIPRIAHGDEIVYSREAKKAHARGHELLQPTKPVAVSAGEAVTWETATGSNTGSAWTSPAEFLYSDIVPAIR
jgi:hypothetical protein